MIDNLAARLVEFPGAPNRARCFTHILNLVVKSIMSQFDLPGKWKKLNPKTDKRTRDLIDLAGDIDLEELVTETEQEDLQDEWEEALSHDNDEGWIDERGNMITEEIEELEASVRPVTILLTKVSK
jgi:hypothetical protein